MLYPVPVERLPTLWSFWLPLSLLLCRSIPLWPRTVTLRLVWGAMERRKKWRGSRRDEEAMHEGREGKKTWENSMGAQDGGWVEDLELKVLCVCLTNMHKKRGCMFLCECGFCVRAYFCAFVFVCVHVCSCVCCVWVGTRPQRAVHCRGSFMISSPKRSIKAPSNTPPFLSAPLCFFPMLPLFAHVLFPQLFFTLRFLCPLCYFTILQSSGLSLSLVPRSSVDLHHFCPYLPLVLFDCISNLRLFSLALDSCFTPCLSVSAFTFSQSFCFPSFLPLSVKWCRSTKWTFWIETFRCEGTNTRSCTQADAVSEWREDYCNMK